MVPIVLLGFFVRTAKAGSGFWRPGCPKEHSFSFGKATDAVGVGGSLTVAGAFFVFAIENHLMIRGVQR